jgi:hypothetical protein
MASSKSQVKELLGAQSVAGNLIVGQRGSRVIVGKTDENGLFELTPEGKELVDAKLNPGKAKSKKSKKAEATETEFTEVADAE